MSFNIRFGSAKDGENHWDKRCALVASTIQQFDPDLLGTQETLEFQAQYIEAQLGQYSYFGRSRMKTPNEHCGIFYRTERFTWLAGGHFWLSETPEIPESKSWDSSLPRMATWVMLCDNRAAGATILFVNTHFDHIGAESRQQSASLIRQRIDQLRSIAKDPFVVVTGDFNTDVDSPPYKSFLDSNDQLVDTFRTQHPQPSLSDGSFNGFNGNVSGPRIDWILADKRLPCTAAQIDHTSEAGRFPSDHFPVTAVLTFPSVQR